MRPKKIIVTIFTSLLITGSLAACSNQIALQKKVAAVSQQSQNQIRSSLSNPSGNENFNITNGRYVDQQAIVIPAKWKTKSIVINAQRQPLSLVINRMTANQDIINIIPPEIASLPVSLNYQGPLYQGLKKLAEKNVIFFTVRNHEAAPVITWSPLETKTFQVAFLPGTTDFNVGDFNSSNSQKNSNSTDANNTTPTNDNNNNNANAIVPKDTSNSGNTSNQQSGASLSGSISVWNDLQHSVKQLLSRNGKLTVDEASSAITVTDNPFAVNRVARFIKHYNKLLSSRVSITVKVLEIQLNNSHAAGINWDMVYQWSQAKLGFGGNFADQVVHQFGNATAGSFGGSILKGPFANTKLLIEALDQQGNTSITNEPTITTLNNNPATIQIGGEESYVKSTSVTVTGSGTGSFSTTKYIPGNITTGMNMTLIPHIQNGKVFLSMDMTIRSLNEIATVQSKTGDEQIQLPNTTVRKFNQRVMAHDGSLIILSGFKLKKNGLEKDQNFGSTLLGGNKGESNDTELVVLIQPHIVKRAL